MSSGQGFTLLMFFVAAVAVAMTIRACGPTGATCGVVHALSVAMSVHLGIDRWCETKAKRGRPAAACCSNALLYFNN